MAATIPQEVNVYSLLMANRWLLLFILEILAWAATFFMLYARYKMRSQFWFKIFSIILVLTGVIPQVLLGIVNFAATQEIDLFTIVIAALIIYGMTLGKKHVRKLDFWAQKKFSNTAS